VVKRFVSPLPNLIPRRPRNTVKAGDRAFLKVRITVAGQRRTFTGFAICTLPSGATSTLTVELCDCDSEYNRGFGGWQDLDNIPHID